MKTKAYDNDNVKVAREVLRILSNAKCTIRDAKEILSFVGETLQVTSVVTYDGIIPYDVKFDSI